MHMSVAGHQELPASWDEMVSKASDRNQIPFYWVSQCLQEVIAPETMSHHTMDDKIILNKKKKQLFNKNWKTHFL